MESLDRYKNAQAARYEKSLKEIRNVKKNPTGCGISFLK